MISLHDRMDAPAAAHSVNLRHPTVRDAAAIWNLVDRCQTLDNNSSYAYLLLASDFADTCAVAYSGSLLVGFVVGYKPPVRPDAVFVWQIGVAPEARGRGLGRRMLRWLITAQPGVSFLEATITPHNAASWRLFESLAEECDCPLTRASHFSADMFAGAPHEAEMLVRIGPLTHKE